MVYRPDVIDLGVRTRTPSWTSKGYCGADRYEQDGAKTTAFAAYSWPISQTSAATS